VNFKVALLPVTLVFALSQVPMMTKHMIQDDPKTPQ
jgi:intracellular septation protein